MNRKLSLPVGLLLLLLIAAGGIIYFSNQSFAPAPISFNDEVRPLLNARCVSCHGGVKKNGGLSLLFREEAMSPAESGKTAIIPGDPDQSELMQRVAHHDPEFRMPLEEAPLKEGEIALLRKWIEEGASWEEHWALAPISQSEVPSIRRSTVLNEVDAFIQGRLKAEGLKPTGKADKETLIRRLSLDLIGLPPGPEEIKAFLENDQDNAYEQEVDRLLASPHFGEKWASMWLDLARYADSQGYQKDPSRSIWQFRDWVIEAFNQNMPFDQFTTEQLAGDLLPAPDKDQLIATAFHRNTMTNDEGGTDDEEFRVAAVLDRVNTTMEVWQGITIGCVQCHSHPYDPFSHEEFYELMAFFNNTADADKRNDFPFIQTRSAVQEKQLKQIEALLAKTDSLNNPEQYLALLDQKKQIRPSRTPIMQDLPPDSSRATFVFERGNWLVHGKEVQPDVPDILPPMEEAFPKNRLGLAKWILSQENPLTSRVIVNRFWEQIFGYGLVKTLEDFGTQGDKPSHPALLDWLAYQFSHDLNWDTKALIKMMVMSHTYQQKSTVSADLLEKDPQNRLLARGPRVRLSAEQIRDQALAVGGLLSRKMYGPSVMPPQPEGVWNTIRHVMKWRTSKGEDKYRRALYTYIRRSSPYPSFLTFDAPNRDICVSRRIRTNTPLQALVTLNDIVYLEAAQALASRASAESQSMESTIKTAYKLAIGKEINTKKLEALSAFADKNYTYYQEHPEDAEKLLSLPKDDGTDPVYLATLTSVSNVIMNLDEFITKE